MSINKKSGLEPQEPNIMDEWIKKLNIPDVVVPLCDYCNDTGWDSYPNHDTTMRPCPECQP